LALEGETRRFEAFPTGLPPPLLAIVCLLDIPPACEEFFLHVEDIEMEIIVCSETSPLSRSAVAYSATRYAFVEAPKSRGENQTKENEFQSSLGS
jgi:hypothetical protein